MVRDVDYLKDLVNYIKKNLRKGYTKESLKWALINQEHSKFEIEKAFQKAEKEMALEAPVMKTKPVIKYEIIGHSAIENTSLKEKKTSFWKNWFG